MEESHTESLTERCEKAVLDIVRLKAVQIKLYVKGKEREALRVDSSFISKYEQDGIKVRYKQGRLDEDFIIFDREG